MWRINFEKKRPGLFHLDHTQCDSVRCPSRFCGDPLLGLFRWANGQSFYDENKHGLLQRSIDDRSGAIKGCFDYFQKLYFVEYFPDRNLIKWCHYSDATKHYWADYCDPDLLENYEEDKGEHAHKVPNGFIQDQLVCAVFNLLLEKNMSAAERHFFHKKNITRYPIGRLKNIVVPDLTLDSKWQYNFVVATISMMDQTLWNETDFCEFELIGSPDLGTCRYTFEISVGTSDFKVNETGYAYMARSFLSTVKDAFFDQ